MSGFKRNTTIVYDMLGEGETQLVNGLASIYLNKTPIVNSVVKESLINKEFSASVSGSSITISPTTSLYANNIYRPIRVQKGYKTNSTCDATADSTTITTDSSFFETAMIASSTSAGGGLYQKIRIPGAGLNGAEYEGEIVDIDDAQTATVTPAVRTTVTNADISFDHFSYGLSTGSGAFTLTDSCPLSGTFNVDVGGASLEYGNAYGGLANYKFVRVSYRSGTLDQPPVSNVAGFSSASFGKIIGTQLKQHSDYYGRKIYWEKYTASDYDSAGGEITVTSDTSLPATADRLLVTITTAALRGTKSINGNTESCGVNFQIWFDYKSGGGSWASELIYGAPDEQISTASTYIWAGTTNPFPGSDGYIVDNDAEASDWEFWIDIQKFKPFDQFKIRVKRITPVNYTLGDLDFTNVTVVKSVQGFIDDQLSYPYTSYVALMFDSNEFEGAYPERMYHCYGIPCWVPTNYMTRAESSDGNANYMRNVSTGAQESTYQVWDGTFRKVYCDNPVWQLRTLLLENRFGLGNWLDAEEISSYSYYSMARRCDELVPDGEGGLEPRFTCGAYLTQASEAYRLIKDICTTMLAIPFWMDGQMTIEGDRPQEPIYTFTKGNIIGGTFTYESTGNKTRPNQYAVSFNNRSNLFIPEVELVDDVEDMINKGRVYTEDCTAFGATSRGQAIRYAKWKLLTSKLNKEICSFRTGDNAGFIRPGNVVRVQDADRYRVRNSGRVVSSTINTITIDKPITLGAGVYTLHVLVEGPATYLAQDSATIDTVDYVKGDQIPIYTKEEAEQIVDDDNENVLVTFSPDMHLENRTVSTSAGSGITTLTVSSNFSETPIVDFIWALTNTVGNATVEGSSKLYKILGITEDEPGVYSLTASEHYNEKFDTLDELYLSDPPDTIPFDDAIPQLTKFTAVQNSRNTGVQDANTGDTIISLDAVLRWNPPLATAVDGTQSIYPNLNYYLLTYELNDGTLVSEKISKAATSYRVDSLLPGTYTFTIQARGITGATTSPISVQCTIKNQNNVPGAVNRRGIPTGGHFSVAPVVEGNRVAAANDYTFVGAAGTTVKIEDGNLT